MRDPVLTRRRFLAGGAAVVAGGGVTGVTGVAGLAGVGGGLGALPAWARSRPDLRQPRASQAHALRALGKSRMRLPDSRPRPAAAVGSEAAALAGIDHIVVLMLENHSYDNFLGMLGRGPGEQPRGDGLTLAADGRPANANPYPDGRPLRAFRMPTTCQLEGHPSQEWEQSHVQWHSGRNDGFVVSDSGPVAMGYWDGQHLPFTYDLATRFPIGDRFFCSTLAQTDPNRRFLIAATSSGMTDDIGGSPGNLEPDLLLGVPPNGTIFERLSVAGVSWTDYCESFPTGATMELYPSVDGAFSATNVKPFQQFFTDAAAGSLPSFSLLDPNYDTQSQEDPQNIVVGEAMLASVVRAVGSSPAWRRTLLIVNYDEHGGYYDHVAPPVALAPDSITPVVQPGESTYDGFARYGFRVPAIVVGPYAKPGYVSHVVHDHASILALVEHKWNLPAMTYRDANANDLTDFVDLEALAAGQPTFPELPALVAAGENATTLACSKTGPGTIPPVPGAPPSPTTPRKLPPIRLQLRDLGIRRHLHGLLLELRTTHGTLTDLELDVLHGRHRVARHRVARVSHAERQLLVKIDGRPPKRGRYTVVVRQRHRTLLRRTLHVR